MIFFLISVIVGIFSFIAGGVWMSQEYKKDIKSGTVSVDHKVYNVTEMNKESS